MDAGLLQPVSRLRRWSQSECSRSRAVRCDPTRGAYCGDGRALPAEVLTPLDASAVETLIFATAGISAAMLIATLAFRLLPVLPQSSASSGA